MHPNPQNLANFYADLKTLGTRGIRCGLERIQAVLPYVDLNLDKQKFIHVAGTNGKGSVCYLITQLLSHSGYRVGLTISPHIEDFRERIQLALPENPVPTWISEEELLACHEELKERLPKDHQLTYFEWNILLALLFFSKQDLDFIVLETGMGGRFDATNICPAKFSAITTIGLDHMEYLGDTPEKILGEKLQIVKSGSEFLFGPTDASLCKVARAHAEKVGAKFHALADVCHSERSEESPGIPGGSLTAFGMTGFAHRTTDFLNAHSPENLAPQAWTHSYLRENLRFALALAALIDKQGHKINFEAFFKSSKIILPPARLEVVQKNPLIIVDGAHNEQGVLALKEYLARVHDNQYTLIFGCLANRPFLKLAEILKSPVENYWLKFDGFEHTTSDAVYQDVCGQLGGEIVGFDEHLRKILNSSRQDRPIVFAGSLYLCSQVKKWLGDR